MNRLTSKAVNSKRRENRVRTVVRGSSERPRLSVNISARHITAQIIDDSKQKTLVYATTTGQKGKNQTMTEQARSIGADIAKQAKAKKITQVAFDRGKRLYHGRVKALAEAARQEGLGF